MISAQTTTFKFIDRGYHVTLVLLPGWASDYRVFETMDLAYNYIIPVNFVPTVFKDELLKTLKKHDLIKVSMLGWSMGGFAASEFCEKYSVYVEELILIGIKPKYEPTGLQLIKRYLNKNKKGYLSRFYSQCFHDLKYRDHFKNNIALQYYEDFDLETLIKGLDYLLGSEIKIEYLKTVGKIKIIHGEFDNIAPLKEAKKIGDDLSQAKFIVVKEMGHLPFLKEDFGEYIK